MKSLFRLSGVLAGMVATSAAAQNHLPFQIARPVGIGAAGTGLDASNRIYRAYPGLRYEIHADAVGGRWPYSYSLSGAPAGMTIEPGPCTSIGPDGCTAGTITWPSPTAGSTAPITVTIRDADGDTVTGTWSVTVSNAIGADGFCFLDADGGNDTTGTGSLAQPYRSIAKAYLSCGPRSVLYFRGAAAAYTIDPSIEDGSNPGDCDRRVGWPEGNRGVVWLGYPGERPVIDFESGTGSGPDAGLAQPCIQMQGANIWIENFELRNVGSIGFKLNLRTNGYGAVVRNVDAHDLRNGGDGKNSSFFLWTRCDTCPTWFDTVQNSRFANVGLGACALKLYGIKYGLFETSSYANTQDGEAALAIKGTIPHYTVRGNACTSTVRTCFGGNQDTAMPCTGTCETTGGEQYHNLVLSGANPNTSEGAITLGVAKVNPVGETWVYRNTLVGQVNISDLASGDGPYHFSGNVIVNSGGSGGACPAGLSCYNASTYAPLDVPLGANLLGTSGQGLIDTNGNLQGTYRTMYLGQRGYELGTDFVSPSSPTNLQVQ